MQNDSAIKAAVGKLKEAYELLDDLRENKIDERDFPMMSQAYRARKLIGEAKDALALSESGKTTNGLCDTHLSPVETCPNCKGEKEVAGWPSHKTPLNIPSVPCPYCQGRGKVPPPPPPQPKREN